MAYPSKDSKFDADRAARARSYLDRLVPIAGTPGERYVTEQRGLPLPDGADLLYLPDPDGMIGEGAVTSLIRLDGEVSALQLTYVDAAGRPSQHPGCPKDKRGERLRRDTFALVKNGNRDGLSTVGAVPGAPTPPVIAGFDWSDTGFLVEGRLEKLIPLAALGLLHVFGAGGLSCIGFGVPEQGTVVIVADAEPRGDRAALEMHRAANRRAVARCQARDRRVYLIVCPTAEDGSKLDTDDLWKTGGADAVRAWLLEQLGEAEPPGVTSETIREMFKLETDPVERQRLMDDLKRDHGINKGTSEAVLKGLMTEELVADDPVELALGLVLEEEAVLEHDDADSAYLTADEGGVVTTFNIRSRSAETWLRNLYGEAMARTVHGKRVPGALRSAALDEVRAQLHAIAMAGELIQPFARVGHHDGRVYLDLANPDIRDRYVEIGPGGWTLTGKPKARMVRMPNAHPLPMPAPAKDPEAVWREFDAITGGRDPKLLRGYQGGLLFPYGPHAALVMVGPPGAGKTTRGKIIKGMLDPTKAAARMKPNSTLDLVIAAFGGWCGLFDNLTGLSQDMSNYVCQILDGAGLTLRQLYTTIDEVTVELGRPLMFTSVNENLIHSPDLIDRGIVSHHRRVGDAARLDEAEMMARAEAIRAQVLTLVLDSAAEALSGWRNVELAHKPRRLGLTRWVEAGCGPLGLEPGEFAAAYVDNQRRALQDAAQANPAISELLAYLDVMGGYHGKSSVLYEQLTAQARNRGAGLPLRWPTTPSAFGTALSKAALGLSSLGWSVESKHAAGGTLVEIKRAGDPPAQDHSSSPRGIFRPENLSLPSSPSGDDSSIDQCDDTADSDDTLSGRKNPGGENGSRCPACDQPVAGGRRYCSPRCRSRAASLRRRRQKSGDVPSAASSASGFTPTTEWQDVPKGAVLPPGLQHQLDPNSGVHRARLMPCTEAPPRASDGSPLKTNGDDGGDAESAKSSCIGCGAAVGQASGVPAVRTAQGVLCHPCHEKGSAADGPRFVDR